MGNGFDAGTTGTLMTYMYKGKQYIVMAIGGQNHPLLVEKGPPKGGHYDCRGVRLSRTLEVS
jgi:hypothetical protein